MKDNPLYKLTASPGPLYNLQNNHSLSVSNSKNSLETGIKNKNSFGNTYEKYKNVYYPELARDFENREGPGPGQYDNKQKSGKDKKYSFPKNSRNLSSSPNKKKSKAPSPASYNVNMEEVKFKGNIGTIFGRSTREIDFSKCRSLTIIPLPKVV